MTPSPRADSGVPLDSVAFVRGGYVPRTLVEDPFGGHRALQARDLAEDGSVDWERLSRPRIDGDATRYELNHGDLVVSLRGLTGRAWQISRPPADVVALGHFAIITATAGSADPLFLLWYLSHPSTRARLQKLTKGSSFPFLSIGEFRRLKIALPPLEVQSKIGQAHTLAARERSLQEKVDALRQRHLNLRLMRAVDPR